MNAEHARNEGESVANDNFSPETLGQEEAEQQRALWSMLGRTVSSDVWQRLGDLGVAQSFDEFADKVEEIKRITRDEGAYADGDAMQIEGTLKFLKTWKLKVSRDTDGNYAYEAIL